MASDEDFQRAAAAASPITTRPSLSAYVRAARRAEADERAFRFPDPIPNDEIGSRRLVSTPSPTVSPLYRMWEDSMDREDIPREHDVIRYMSLETCDEVMELLADGYEPRSVVGRVYGHTAALARVDFQ